MGASTPTPSMADASINRQPRRPPMIGEPWVEAPPFPICHRPWETAVHENATVIAPLAGTARLQWHADALYCQFHVADRYQIGLTTTMHGPVWEDSCVELFVNPTPEDGDEYLNLEINCLGTIRAGYGPSRAERSLLDSDLVSQIHVITSIRERPKRPDPDRDRTWWLVARVPRAVLEEATGSPITVTGTSTWLGNLHCCRERDAPSFVTWAPIDTPAPDFHQPTCFRTLSFD